MIRLTIDNIIRILLEDISDDLRSTIECSFSYPNVEYLKLRNILKNIDKKIKGLPPNDPTKGKFEKMYKQTNNRLFYVDPQIKSFIPSQNGFKLFIPRGAKDKLLKILSDLGQEISIQESYPTYQDMNFELQDDIKLSGFQVDAVNKLFEQAQGILISPTASGKTMTMLALIAKIKKPALILVHTTGILKHWKSEILNVLKIRKKDIGQIGAGKKIIAPITIAMLPTLWRYEKSQFKELNDYFGIMVMSEVHHCPSDVTFRVINRIGSQYRYGESATKKRKDGKDPLMLDLISHDIVEVQEEKARQEHRTLTPSVEFVHCHSFKYDFFNDYVPMLGKIVKDNIRNNLIVENIKKDIQLKHKVLVLSDRIQHCKAIHKLLKRQKVKSELILGSVDYADRDDIIKKINGNKCEVILVTTTLGSEGINIPILSSLHLVTPSNNFELSKQRTGRVRRVCKNKPEPIVRDYVDSNCDYLINIAKNRYRFYKKLGYTILNYVM